MANEEKVIEKARPDIAQIDQMVDLNGGTQIIRIRHLSPDKDGKPRPDIHRGVAKVNIQGREAKFEFGFPPELSLEECFARSEEFGQQAFASYQKEQASQIVVPGGIDMSKLKKNLGQ